MNKVSTKITNWQHRWNLYWARQHCSGTPKMKKIYAFGKRIAPLVPGIRVGRNNIYVRAIKLANEIRSLQPGRLKFEELKEAHRSIKSLESLIHNIGGSLKDFRTSERMLTGLKEQLTLALAPQHPKITYSFNSLLSAFHNARKHLPLSIIEGMQVIENILQSKIKGSDISISIGYKESAAKFLVWAGHSSPSFTVQRDGSIIIQDKDFSIDRIESIINELISFMSSQKPLRVDPPAPMIEAVPVKPEPAATSAPQTEIVEPVSEVEAKQEQLAAAACDLLEELSKTENHNLISGKTPIKYATAREILNKIEELLISLDPANEVTINLNKIKTQIETKLTKQEREAEAWFASAKFNGEARDQIASNKWLTKIEKMLPEVPSYLDLVGPESEIGKNLQMSKGGWARSIDDRYYELAKIQSRNHLLYCLVPKVRSRIIQIDNLRGGKDAAEEAKLIIQGQVDILNSDVTEAYEIICRLLEESAPGSEEYSDFIRARDILHPLWEEESPNYKRGENAEAREKRILTDLIEIYKDVIERWCIDRYLENKSGGAKRITQRNITEILLAHDDELTSVPIKSTIRIMGGNGIEGLRQDLTGEERIVKLSRGKDYPSIHIFSPLDLEVIFDRYRINQLFNEERELEPTKMEQAGFDGMLKRAAAYFTSPQMAWITSQFNGSLGGYKIEIDGQIHYVQTQGGRDFHNPGPCLPGFWWSHFLMGNFVFDGRERSLPIARLTMPVWSSPEEKAAQLAPFIKYAASITT